MEANQGTGKDVKKAGKKWYKIFNINFHYLAIVLAFATLLSKYFFIALTFNFVFKPK